MDDFPAGPACPEARGPLLSVVIPVRDGGLGFERCLQGLRASSGPDFELIVVDDGSLDSSGVLASRHGATVIRNEVALGPAAARNAGARAASGRLVFFLDADVVPHPDTLSKAIAHFARQPDLAGLFGSYDDAPAAPGVISRYRNLLHHYVHQQGVFVADARPAHTFWTGCGVIRRDVFLALGGFDPELYRRPAIEDIELGYRLHRAGHRIVLARDVQVQHLKRWTLRSILRTDLLHRGIPWMLLILRSRVVEADLNVSPAQRRSVALTGLALLATTVGFVIPGALLASLGFLLLVARLNRDFYRFLAARCGWPRAVASFPLHLVYFVCCGLSVVIAAAWLALSRIPGSADTGRDRHRPAAVRASTPAPLGRRGRTPRAPTSSAS
jgi:glycosyltransferase involved in cell wall biosynthesis